MQPQACKALQLFHIQGSYSEYGWPHGLHIPNAFILCFDLQGFPHLLEPGNTEEVHTYVAPFEQQLSSGRITSACLHRKESMAVNMLHALRSYSKNAGCVDYDEWHFGMMWTMNY